MKLQPRFLIFCFTCLVISLSNSPAFAVDDRVGSDSPAAVSVIDKEDIEALPKVKINAARLNIAPSSYPASITVIDEEEIKESGHTQVNDILREQLGMNVVQNGPAGASSTVFLRGANNDSTLVMIDGVRVNSNTLGHYDFRNLTTDNIESIEILRGIQSTIWGADAVGGVINIVTKKGRGKPSAFFSFEGGSYETFRETAGTSGSINDFDFSLTASRLDTAGFSSVNDRFEHKAPITDDEHQNTTVSGRFGYNFLGDGRVEVIGRYTDSEVDIDDFKKDSVVRSSTTEAYNVSLPIQKSILPFWHVKLNPSYTSDTVEDINPGTPTSRIINKNYTIDLQNNLEVNEYLDVVFGWEYKKLKGENVTATFEEVTRNHGIFLQTQVHCGDTLVLTGGFRHDINSKFEDATTYRFEGAYKIAQTGTRVRGAYATGFKAPTFNQLFFPNFGNPGIQPEESEGWEVGLDQDILNGLARVEVTYFYTEFENLIETVFIPPFTFQAENVAKATTQGVETHIRVNLPMNFGVSLNHTWLDAEDEDGEQLQRRPTHNFNVNVTHHWNNKLHSLVGVRVRSGSKSNSSGTQHVTASTVVRAALSYQVNEMIKLTARGENIFDENYEEIHGFSTAGASGYAGFELFFN